MRSDIREPAVAGSFYEHDASRLRSSVAALLDAALPAPDTATALIAPHAGYAYSGPIAASAFRGLEARQFERVIVIGPSHFVAFRGIAASGARGFSTPLGTVALDTEAEAALERAGSVSVAPHVHAPEHCIEVELPFLQVALRQPFRLVALVVGEALPQEVATVLDSLWTEATLLVVSSDLTHFLDYDTAKAADHATAEAISTLARDDFTAEEACGATAINGLVSLARRRGLVGRTLDLRSSGDVCGGRDSVVGYGAWAFRPLDSC